MFDLHVKTLCKPVSCFSEIFLFFPSQKCLKILLKCHLEKLWSVRRYSHTLNWVKSEGRGWGCLNFSKCGDKNSQKFLQTFLQGKEFYIFAHYPPPQFKIWIFFNSIIFFFLFSYFSVYVSWWCTVFERPSRRYNEMHKCQLTQHFQPTRKKAPLICNQSFDIFQPRKLQVSTVV